jgi:hypothetical protein
MPITPYGIAFKFRKILLGIHVKNAITKAFEMRLLSELEKHRMCLVAGLLGSEIVPRPRRVGHWVCSSRARKGFPELP